MFVRTFLCLAPLVWASPSFAQCSLAPVAVDDVVRASGTVVVIDVLANDYDPDGDPLKVSLVSQTCDGLVVVDHGLIVFTPSSTVTTDCTMTYQAADEGGLLDEAVVAVFPTAAPPPPPPPPGNLIFGDGFETGDLSRWTNSQGFGR